MRGTEVGGMSAQNTVADCMEIIIGGVTSLCARSGHGDLKWG